MSDVFQLKINPTPLVIGSTHVPVYTEDLQSIGINVMMNEFNEEKQTVLLLHGYVGSSQDYMGAFEKFGHNYNLIAIDLRGHGSSEVSEKEWTIKDLTADIYQVVKLIIPEYHKLIVVGNSLSTAVALEFAIKYPQIVHNLFLISPTTEFEFSIWKKLAITLLKQVPNPLIKLVIDLVGVILPRVHWNKEDREFLKIGMRKVKSVDVSTHKTILDKTLVSHLIDPNQVTQPVLIIAGENDKLVPFWRSVELNDGLGDSSIIVLERTKHQILTRRPQIVLDLLEQWLEMDFKILEKKVYREGEFIRNSNGDNRLLVN
jgi:pimeloyl-ACP methyl ester carboxylesterase